MNEQNVSVDGGNIFVKQWTLKETQSKPTIILMHDSLGCVDMWRDFPALLCQKTGCNVIAYDRLGFGKSDTRAVLPSTRFINEEAEIYFPEVLKSLHIKKFFIFGHSVGGSMAMLSSVNQPQCLGVITESAQAFVEDRTRDGILKAEANFKNPEIYNRLKKYHADRTQWVLDAWIKVWLSGHFKDWSLEKDLMKVTCPVLIIHGDRDEYGSIHFPEAIAKWVAGSSQKEIIKDCGHVPHREKSDFILDLVSHFINKYSP